MITVTRNSTPLSAWHLTDQDQMLEALNFLSGQGWRGSITFVPESDVWRIELNADNPTRQLIAEIGDWIVVDIDVRKLSDQQCADNYEVTE